MELVKDPRETERIWWVVCGEYAIGPFTKDGAKAKRSQIEGSAYCSEEHKIRARTGGLGRRW